MFHRPILVLCVVLLLSGCATGMGPIDKIPIGDKVALISSIDAPMHGYREGIGEFGNGFWVEEAPPFDANAVALEALRANLNRTVKLVDGDKMGISFELVRGNAAAQAQTEDLRQKLWVLGQEWQVDYIGFIEWSYSVPHEYAAPMESFGHYSRVSFKAYNRAYGYFDLRVFDCKTGQFTAIGGAGKQVEIPGVTWHESWQQYPPEEQRLLVQGIKDAISASMIQFLVQAGLTDIKLKN